MGEGNGLELAECDCNHNLCPICIRRWCKAIRRLDPKTMLARPETPPWLAGASSGDRVLVERVIDPPHRSSAGTTTTDDILCEVHATEARYGEPAYSALQNAARVARALNNASYSPSDAVAVAKDRDHWRAKALAKEHTFGVCARCVGWETNHAVRAARREGWDAAIRACLKALEAREDFARLTGPAYDEVIHCHAAVANVVMPSSPEAPPPEQILNETTDADSYRFCDSECAEGPHRSCGPCAHEHRWRAKLALATQRTAILTKRENEVLRTCLGRLFKAIPDGTALEIDKDTAEWAERCGEAIT